MPVGLGACVNASISAAGAGCPAGEVAVEGGCGVLCASHSDCPVDEVCNASGVCRSGGGVAANVPRIASVNGDGSADGRAGYTANRLAQSLTLTGTNLQHTVNEFSVRLLDPAGVVTDLTDLVLSSASETLTVSLPDTLADDTQYTIRVSNQFGADQATVLILQGEAGANGAAGRDGVCTADCGETTPNTQRQSTIELRAVNPVNASFPSRLRVDTGGATALSGENGLTPSSAGAGVLVLLLDLNSSVPNAHTLAPTPANLTPFYTQYDAIVTLLDAVNAGTLVAMVSYGDIGNMQAGTSTLDDFLTRLEGFGAPRDVRDLSTNEGFVFAGHRRIGRGNAYFARISESDPAWDLDGDAGTTDDMGRSVGTRLWVVNDQLVGVHGSGSGRFRSAIIANAGLTVATGQAFAADTGTFSGALAAQGGATVSGGLLTASGGLTVSGGALTASNGLSVSGGLLTAGAGLTVNGGALTASSGLSVSGGLLTATGGATISGGTLTASNGLSVTGGAVSVTSAAGGALVLPDNGSLTVGGAAGSVHLGSGNLNAGDGTFSGAVVSDLFKAGTFGTGADVNLAFDDAGKVHITSDDDGTLGAGDVQVLTVSSDGGGRVGILKAAPSQALDVTGNIVASGSVTAGSMTVGTGKIHLSDPEFASQRPQAYLRWESVFTGTACVEVSPSACLGCMGDSGFRVECSDTGANKYCLCMDSVP